jgi:hypothetical protein
MPIELYKETTTMARDLIGLGPFHMVGFRLHVDVIPLNELMTRRCD